MRNLEHRRVKYLAQDHTAIRVELEFNTQVDMIHRADSSSLLGAKFSVFLGFPPSL